MKIDIFFIAANRLDSPFLPVGIAYVMQAAENAGFTYEFSDITLDSEEKIIRRIELIKPSYVGIGTMTLEVFKNYNLINKIKEKCPTTKIILGGPHVLADGELIFDDCPQVDIAIQGEGEEAIVKILNGEGLKNIPHVIFKNPDGTIQKNNVTFLEIEKIDFPKYNKVPLEKYPPLMNIASSRGCVQSCIFCGARRFLGRIWRAFPPKRMYEEFYYWYEKGYRRFYFSDSLFSKDKQRILDFCDLVKKSGIKDIRFTADGVRADHLDFHLLKTMKEIGFTDITMGVESVSNNVLKFMAKGETFEQIDAAIKMADALDYKIGCFFILGSPDETQEEMEASLRFPLQYKNIRMVHYHKLTPVPGTPYFEYAVKHGLADQKTRYGTTDEFWAIAKHGTNFVKKEILQDMLYRGLAMEKFISFRGIVLDSICQQTGRSPSLKELNEFAINLWKQQGNDPIAESCA